MTKAWLLLFLTLPALAAADTVTLQDGETIEGTLLGTQANFVLLQLPEIEGEATLRLNPSDIAALAFSDEDTPLQQRALTRAKFIPLLSERDAALLPQFLAELVESEHPLSALSYAKLWHPKNTYKSNDSLYRALLIESSLAAGLPDEAHVHAQRWLSLSPPPFSHPLPWTVVAQRQLDQGHYQAALWTSLTPIAHARLDDRKAIEPLRRIASQSYQKLGHDTHAQAYLTPAPRPDSPLRLDPAHFLLP